MLQKRNPREQARVPQTQKMEPGQVSNHQRKTHHRGLEPVHQNHPSHQGRVQEKNHQRKILLQRALEQPVPRRNHLPAVLEQAYFLQKRNHRLLELEPEWIQTQSRLTCWNWARGLWMILLATPL